MKPPDMPEAIKRFVYEARVCRIASVGPGAEPHAIPVCPVFDGETTLYIDIGRRYTTAENLAANPKLALLVDEYDEDWSLLKGVLLRCDVQEAQGEEKDRAWALIRAKFPQYKVVDWGPRLTLALRIYDWRQWGIIDRPA